MRTRLKPFSSGERQRRRRLAAFTLTELLVASGLGLMIASVVAVFSLYSARTFAAFGNYQDLDSKSRNALDFICRELRQNSSIVACNSNLPVKTLALYNPEDRTTNTLTYDADARTLVFDKSGWGSKVLLVGCDSWDFQLFNRAATLTNSAISLNAASSPDECKLIRLTWTCSREIMNRTANTESSQSAEIVLRNSHN
jgi:hypothetical protein